MPKTRTKRTKASTSSKEIDPLDVTDEISIKEEKIDEIKNEVADLDLGHAPVPDIQLEIKKEIEEFPSDHFLTDPKDIPGIEKIVNIEDILKNHFNSTDSTNLLSSKNANNTLQNCEIALSKNSSVSKDNKSLTCNCMQHFEHYCITCDVAVTYKADKTECLVCKSALKLRCSKCRRKFKFLSSTHQYLLQYSRRLNLLSNEKKGITLKCQKQVNFCCSVCLFKTDNKVTFDQHVKTHSVIEKFKQSDHSKVDKHNNTDDEFIEMYCAKCFKTKKNLSYDNHAKHGCEECQEVMLYQCTFCKKPYKSLLNIRLHIKDKCLQRIEHFKFHCDHCHFKIEDKSKLELHIKLVHTAVTCEHCEREFVNSSAIKQHKTKGCPAEKCKRKTEMYKSKIQTCKSESTYSSSLLEDDSYQVVQYHPEEIYNEICSRPPKDLHYSGWQSMINYYCLLCDGQTDKKISKYKPWCRKCKIKYEYRCKICEKLYDGYSSICTHVTSECPARYNLACSMCDFTSAQKQILISHIKNKHTVFKCLQCESRYHGYLSLRRHLLSNCKIANIHTEKHVQKLIALYCKQCCKRVINFEGSSLKSCTKCTSIMTYQCLKCNQVFDVLEVAHKHVKNECNPQFNCTKCKYNAYTQFELDVHIKYVHTNRECPDCGVQFRDEQIFKLHRFEELKRKEEKKKVLSKQEAKRIKLS